MLVHQSKTPDVHAKEVRRILASLLGSCIGCADCKGSCAALFEMIVVPETVLSRASNA